MNPAGGPTLDALSARVLDRERELFAGRPVVLVTPVLAAATEPVERLRELGAGPMLVVTFGVGTGPTPEAGSVAVHLVAAGDVADVSGEIELWTRVLRTPPRDVADAIEDFDPDGRAVVRNGTPVATDPTLLGRPVVGGRSLADERLEDKTVCGAVFRRAGVRIAPEQIVRSELEALQAAADDLDAGDGVVISSDASRGLSGGAARVWWARDRSRVAEIADAVSAGGETARVMPFLEGQPCSIHGLVTGDGVAVLRPVELCMLRPAGGTGFRQAGISTWWDPDDDARAQMREVARRTGAVLAVDHGYRGAFGIDGILTADGFVPHEINPRFSGGLSAIGKGLPGIPLRALDAALRSGFDLGVGVAELEAALLTAADERRFGSAYLSTTAIRPDHTETVLVSGGPDRLEVAGDHGRPSGTLELGPATAGALVRFTPLALVEGERLTPWAAAAYRLADRLWDTCFGEFELPATVRD